MDFSGYMIFTKPFSTLFTYIYCTAILYTCIYCIYTYTIKHSRKEWWVRLYKHRRHRPRMSFTQRSQASRVTLPSSPSSLSPPLCRVFVCWWVCLCVCVCPTGRHRRAWSPAASPAAAPAQTVVCVCVCVCVTNSSACSNCIHMIYSRAQCIIYKDIKSSTSLNCVYTYKQI